MSLFFITGNAGKLAEAKALIPQIEGLEIDVPEIQSLDSHKIIKAKLMAAREKHAGELVIEDTSLYIDDMNGLPGPFIKWFLESVGPAGIYKIAESLGSCRATARTIAGYVDKTDKIMFFEGEVKGELVAPRGEGGFGYDTIFQPDGYDQTFAEMGLEEKNKISNRKQAFSKLAEHLAK